VCGTGEVSEGFLEVGLARHLVLSRAADQDVKVVHLPLGLGAARLARVLLLLLVGHDHDLPLLAVLGLARLVDLVLQLDVRVQLEVLRIVLAKEKKEKNMLLFHSHNKQYL
jgi:hypothetical protein